jgi:hypothetical protein
MSMIRSVAVLLKEQEKPYQYLMICLTKDNNISNYSLFIFTAHVSDIQPNAKLTHVQLQDQAPCNAPLFLSIS